MVRGLNSVDPNVRSVQSYNFVKALKSSERFDHLSVLPLFLKLQYHFLFSLCACVCVRVWSMLKVLSVLEKTNHLLS